MNQGYDNDAALDPDSNFVHHINNIHSDWQRRESLEAIQQNP